MDLHLRDLMTPAPLTAAPTDTLATAADAMRRRDVSSAVILRDAAVVGILTERDLTRAAAAGRGARHDGRRGLDDARSRHPGAGERDHGRARAHARAQRAPSSGVRRGRAGRHRVVAPAGARRQPAARRPVGTRHRQGAREHHRRRDQDLAHRRHGRPPGLRRARRRAARAHARVRGRLAPPADGRAAPGRRVRAPGRDAARPAARRIDVACARRRRRRDDVEARERAGGDGRRVGTRALVRARRVGHRGRSGASRQRRPVARRRAVAARDEASSPSHRIPRWVTSRTTCGCCRAGGPPRRR